MTTASPGTTAQIQKTFGITDAYNLLYNRWGQQHWWPGDSRIEIIAGALLAQATNWRNASRAVANLKSRNLLEDNGESLSALLSLPDEDLEKLIRPSGYFRQKRNRLRRLFTCLLEHLGEPPWMIPSSSLTEWRERLLAVNGLGPETVDSILLYGFGLPVFVVDAYTRRTLIRHGIVRRNSSYEEIRELFEKKLNGRSELYNEYHALIVRLGKEHCRSVPCCAGCPLADESS